MTKRQYLLKRDKPDSRDFILRAPAPHLRTAPLPPKVDLRNQMSPVVDQESLGSCSSNATISGFREFWQLKVIRGVNRLSRLYHYWHERDQEGTVDEDSGAYLRDAFKVLNELGVCTEADWPYDVSKFRDKPSQLAEAEAYCWKITEYHRLADLDDMKHVLAEGHPKLAPHGVPVVFGIAIYESFESDAVAVHGNVPMPNKATEQCLGGHAMCAVGYDDERQVIIVRNSWGYSWGDEGHCYIPYTYFQDCDLLYDMWTGVVDVDATRG